MQIGAVYFAMATKGYCYYTTATTNTTAAGSAPVSSGCGGWRGSASPRVFREATFAICSPKLHIHIYVHNAWRYLTTTTTAEPESGLAGWTVAAAAAAVAVSINRDVISNVITGRGPRKSGHLQSEHRWTCSRAVV